MMHHIMSISGEKELHIGVARICKKCYTYDGV